MGETVEGHRAVLLEGLRRFVAAAINVPGVRRIGLVGSIVAAKPDPKDIDVLVVVADEADLAPLAVHARRLQGHAQSVNRGADVFLANERGEYIGRTFGGRIAARAFGDHAMRAIAVDDPICTTISMR